MLLRVLCLGLSLVVSIRSAAAQEVQITTDVVYGHKDGMALTFDVLRPADANRAAVLALQSGGWYSGWAEPAGMPARYKYLLDEGFTVFIVRHGSAPRYQVPDAVNDVRRCVRFIRAHCDDYGVEADRIGVTGGSAGGHLTLMLATTGDDGLADSKDPVLRVSSRIQAGVALFPPTDLRGWTTDPPAAIAAVPGLKPPLSFDSSLETSVSPLLHVTSDDAPMMLIHGDKDTLVPIEHSLQIEPVFQQHNVVHELVTIEGAGHGYSPEQNSTIVYPAMVRWFQQHLLSPQ